MPFTGVEIEIFVREIVDQIVVEKRDRLNQPRFIVGHLVVVKVVEGVLFVRCAARCNKGPVGREDLALRVDHSRKLRSDGVVHSAGEFGIAPETTGQNADPQARELREKHESVVCHVMVSFILMTEAGDGQVEHRVKDRAATAGGGKRRNRFSVGALIQGDG